MNHEKRSKENRPLDARLKQAGAQQVRVMIKKG